MGDRGHNRHGLKRWGLLCPFRAELGLRLIQCGLGRGLLPYQVASSSIQPFGHNKHGPKTGKLQWNLNKSSAIAEMGDRGHNRHGPKRGECYAPFVEAGTPSSTMWPGPRSTSVFRTKRRLHPSSHLATIDMGQKLGGWVCPLFWG